MNNNLPLSQRVKSRAFWIKQIRDLCILLAVLFVIASYLQRNMINNQAPPLSAITVQ